MTSSSLTLTPTARLARRLAQNAVLERNSEAVTAWATPRILSFSAWLTTLQQDWLLYADDERVPINRSQSAYLWQAEVDRDVFIGRPRVAELAQRAWQTIHDYRLPPPARWPDAALSEDSRQFRDWSSRFLERCDRAGLIDEARFAALLPEWLAQNAHALPATIRLHGFDLPLTPLQEQILDACEQAGVQIIRPQRQEVDPGAGQVLAFPSAAAELDAAAHWARALLETRPGAQVGIVVADLGSRVDAVDACLRRTFSPANALLEAGAPEPWHISLGKPLKDWPLVADALLLLHLDPRRLSQPQLLRLSTSPFLAGEQEMTVRLRALHRLQGRAPYDVTLEEWLTELDADAAPQTCAALRRWLAVRGEATGLLWPQNWVRQLQQELSALGFGHGRSLDSREYQTLMRWHQLLESFAALDAVLATPLDRTRALAELDIQAAAAVFRERNTGTPLEVLGIEEALGARFDALWITSFDSTRWPGPSQRDPLLPSVFQGPLPRATADSCLDRSRLELDGLLATAPMCTVSFARGTDEAPLTRSALLPQWPELAVETGPSFTIGPATPLEPIDGDTCAPPLATDREHTTAGGTGILKSQSACPFQAFATYRLRALEPPLPRPGLSPADRGILAHGALEALFRRVADSRTLAGLSTEELESLIEHCVQRTLDEQRTRYRWRFTASSLAGERRRLKQLLARWVETVEQPRDGFTVVAREQSVTLSLGPLTLAGTIDRVDRNEDGSQLIIDYKSSAPAGSALVPDPRLREPQLPAYALASDPPADAVAFGNLGISRLGLTGYARSDWGIKGIALTATKSELKADPQAAEQRWQQWLDSWRTQLAALAADFAAGQAAVTPRDAAVCSRCTLTPLCRIREHTRFAADEDASPLDESSDD